MEQNQVGVGISVLVKKLGLILSVLVFLLPVFFVPVSGVSLYVAKMTLLATGLVAIFAVFLSSVLSVGTIEMPKARFLIPLVALALVALVSSLISGSINSSIVGLVFDLGTSGSILMLVFSVFLTIFAVKSLNVVSRAFMSFVYASVVLAVWTLLSVLVAIFSASSPAWFAKIPTFLSGGAIDMAIVFGAAVIFALCMINMTEVSKRFKIVLSLLMAFALIFIGATNFTPVIVILGLISLIFLVYILSWSVGQTNGVEGGWQSSESEGQNKKISLSSLGVLVVSVVLLLGGSNVGEFLAKTLRIQTLEVRPNLQITMDLSVAAWQKNFALGVGPNRFAEFWSERKPLSINQTQFWNTDFYFGSGFVPTLAITTGLLGLFSVLAFLVLYVLSGVKAIFAQANSGRSRYLATTSFLVSLYLWVIMFFYAPSISVLALTFIFTGLFTATLVPQGIIGSWRINIFANPKTNFLSVLSIVVLLIMSVAGGYLVWERAVAATIFERGIIDYQKNGNTALAKESIAKSLNMAPSDVYWRGLAEVYLLDLNRILGGITDQNQITESIKVEVQNAIAGSVEAAKKATESNNKNFSNWFMLGQVYEVLAGNGIEGSIESARSAYGEAALRSPNNPSVPLALARLEAMSKNITLARENITKALALKNNYTDAFYALAQLEMASNNIPAAIRSVEAAAIVEPNNAGLYFQLGLLKYSERDFAGAALAFERAIVLVPDYANAKYYLGISYYQTSKKTEAIKLFEDLAKNNPDNQDVLFIFSNMKAGKSLFPTAQISDKSEPPVKD